MPGLYYCRIAVIGQTFRLTFMAGLSGMDCFFLQSSAVDCWTWEFIRLGVTEMPAIAVPCPACKSLLKLPDARLVGKSARCPKCSHKFVIQLPAATPVPEVSVSEALPQVPSQSVAVSEQDELPVLPLAPRAGRAARWVPDHEVGSGAAVAPSSAPLKSPIVAAESAAAVELPDFGSFGVTEPVSAAAGGVQGSAALAGVRGRRRRGGGMAQWISLAAAGLLAAGITVYAVLANRGAVPAERPVVRQNKGWEQEQKAREVANAAAEELSPTKGAAIPLDHVPFTPHVIVHLRPAQLWQKSERMGEFQALLGNLGIWLTEQIQRVSRFEPAEIEELTIALNFGARMALPDLAMVVRLKERQTASDLLKRFAGRLRPDANSKAEVYEAEDFAFLLVDQQTFVAAPLTMSEELADFKDGQALPLPDMEPLLLKSDRQRHVSVLFDLTLLDSHREDAFIPQLQPAADKVLFWFGDQVESVLWSLHLEPDFYMETLLSNSRDSTPVRLQRQMQVQLDNLPALVLGMVRQMQPSTEGSREIIGRFPAMLQALNVGTTVHAGAGFARLVTVLPGQAAGNLAAGTLLTWNQSLVTVFRDETKQTKADDSQVPEKIVDRLQMKVLVDFRRTPLQEAFGYLGESIRTDVVIDGDALKGAGFTQNMPQTMDLGTVTVLQAIDRILQNYEKERDPLVLVVDEGRKRLLLSTKTKAEADGLKIFDTKAK
jgi:hypothetical protein